MAGITGEAVMDAALVVMDAPFVWGTCDCCTAACDVFAALHGADPMATFRGRYVSEREALAMIGDAGGWLAFADGAAALAGMVATDNPVPGDIGLTVGPHRSFAVCIGAGIWAAKTKLGLAVVTKIERAWRAV